jgi:hypothetical protein
MNYFQYLKDNPKGYWFKRKLYGWGWVPVKWQGWLVVGVYVLALVLFSLTIDESSSALEVFFTFILPILLLTVVLIRICYKKGEKPRWSWGK